MVTLGRVLFVTFNIILINGESLPTEVVFSPSELINSSLISNSSIKSALRYGFHQTSECPIFEKAFICIQKCKDLNYDVAYSDKYCFCTCYTKRNKYTTNSFSSKTRWKYGAPTTSIPAWAQKNVTVKYGTSTVLDNDGEDNESNATIADNLTNKPDIDVGNKTVVSNQTDASTDLPDDTNVTLSDNATVFENTADTTDTTIPTTVL